MSLQNYFPERIGSIFLDIDLDLVFKGQEGWLTIKRTPKYPEFQRIRPRLYLRFLTGF